MNINIFEQIKKSNKYDNWENVPENIERIKCFQKDDSFCGFLAGIMPSIVPFKECDNWNSIECDIHLDFYKKNKFNEFYGFTSYTLKELKRAFKEYVNREDFFNCPNCQYECMKKNNKKNYDFFETYILKGNFYRLEGYSNYRILICFNNI